MIVIFASFDGDPTVVQLSKIVRHQGGEPVVVTPSTMAGRASFAIAPNGSAQLQLDDRVIDLADVEAAWLWRGWQPHPDDFRYRDLATHPQRWSFFQREWATFHQGIALSLAYHGVFCVNPPHLEKAFREKACQLMLAAEAGLQIPSTLYTAHLPLARAFYDRHDDTIIYKPFTPYLHTHQVVPGEPLRVQKLLTNRVHADDLIEQDGALPTPGVFQPYIEKQIELRVVIVGRRIFACAIHSQQSTRSRDDWRRYDLDNTPYAAYNLPPIVADKLLRLMDRMGLVFGSVDLIVTPTGEYVFLEINPSGQFDWIAKLSGMPIYEHLAAMLRAGRVDYPAPLLDEVAHVG